MSREQLPACRGVSAFIQKTYKILHEPSNQSIIRWSSCGIGSTGQLSSTSFKIYDVKSFEAVILPRYFKHSNLSSFVRQLNMYGFHKVRGDKSELEFEHDKFRKDHPELLVEIKRRANDNGSQSLININSQTANSASRVFMGNSEGVVSLQNIAEMEEQYREMSMERQSELNKPKANLEVNRPSRKSGTINSFQSLEQVSSLKNRLQQLQQRNELIKLIRESKLNEMQRLTTEKYLVGYKFTKLLLILFAQKYTKQSRDQAEMNSRFGHNSNPYQSMGSPIGSDSSEKRIKMEELINHVNSNGDELPFTNYSELLKSLMTPSQ